MDGPRTAESVRFLEMILGSMDRRFGPIFRGTHERPNRSKFFKENTGIHGPPIWSEFLKADAATDGQIGPNF